MSDSDSDASSLDELEYIPDSSHDSSSEEDDTSNDASPPDVPRRGQAVTPYAYAPMYTDQELGAMGRRTQAEAASSVDSPSLTVQPSTHAIGAAESANAAPLPSLEEFCKCTRCIVMPRREENVCCHGQNRSTFPCVTQDPDFQGCVLNKMTLEVAAMHQDFHERGRRDFTGFRLKNDVYRYLAKRQATYALHQAPLGRGNPVPLPACVVTEILRKFPMEPEESPSGFRQSDQQLGSS